MFSKIESTINSKSPNYLSFRYEISMPPAAMNQVSMPVAAVSVPVSMPPSMPKTGGKRRKTRGGNVIAQAIVPASLILMNNAMGKISRRRHR